MRVNVTLLVCLLTSVFMTLEASASVDIVTNWPAKPTIVSNGAATSGSGIFTAGSGNNRVMLVAVASKDATAGTARTISVNYGGATATAITGAINNAQTSKIWVGYLTEAQIFGATSKTLTVTNTGPALSAFYVTAAVFAGVDQGTLAAAMASSANSTLSATTLATSATYAVAGINGNNGLSVFISNFTGQALTANAGYTKIRDYAGTVLNLAGGVKTVVAGTDQPSVTVGTAAAGAIAGISLSPGALKISANSSCGDCHGNPPQDTTVALGRNVPAGQFLGSHDKHAGGNDLQYGYACTACHYNNTTWNHSQGFRNITGAKLPKNAYSTGNKIADNNGVTALGTCNNTICHSTGRSNIQYTTTPAWGGAATTCLSCHGGRNGANPAKSTSGFGLSTTHSQHLKYPAGNVNCQMCHSKSVTDAQTLKSYSGLHVNGLKTVLFNDINYGSYTSYKTSGADIGKCTNVACHGGKTRAKWSNANENGGLNNNNTCTHCHGVASGITPAMTDLKNYAPGWVNLTAGTSTDQNNLDSDVRVGAHFSHLSSVYMKKIKCNECHTVPSNVFDGQHMVKVRYTGSPTITFAQASSATKNGVFTSFTSGTASKAATCSTIYCHGSAMPKGDTGGPNTNRKPSWNMNTLIARTPGTVACGVCHGNPPSTGSALSISSHSGKTATVSCYTCHPATVNSSGAIIDKTKHINGQAEFFSHAFPYQGATHAAPAGTTPWTGCTGCHTNGSNTTYPVAKGVAPDCRGCHTLALSSTPSGTSACNDCHGATVTDGRPSGAVFPNWSGNHTRHVVNQGLACSACHGPYGGNIGDTKHGFNNRTAHTFALGFVNLTSTTAQFHFTKTDNKTGSCSTNACHATATWGQKFTCNSCHSYLATDAWASTYGIEGASASAHQKHINYLVTRNAAVIVGWSANDSYGSSNFNAVCGVCHSRTVSDHSMNKADNRRNINFGGVTDRQFGSLAPAYNGDLTTQGGGSSAVKPKSCSNIDCHYRTSPIWSTY